jgi:hypothetical protein
LAECLHRQWGFFFTCNGKAAATLSAGSRDLYSAAMAPNMNVRLEKLTEGNNNFTKKLSQNQWQARHRVERVLKARFVFLKFFVKVGKELKKTDLYLRQCWVLLQLGPGLINWSDIFDDLTNWFSHASDEYL